MANEIVVCIKNLNRLSDNDIRFYPVISDDQVTEIHVRFPRTAYYIHHYQWIDAIKQLSMISRYNVSVTSDETQLNAGIINLAVNPTNHNYTDGAVVDCLQWLVYDLLQPNCLL